MTTPAAFFARITRLQASLLVLALWAAIYLPVLGSLEIKGEEGRRILPAVTMLDTGDWLVPQVGGVPYFSKPPLINWLIAKSFQWTGVRNEWAARLPSVFAVLALGLAAVWTLSRWLGPGGALLTAIFLLTNIGLMEKGRLAEIESLYLSLYGLALLTWLGAWRHDADRAGGRRPAFPWRAWTLPFVFLGLGLLTKGPLHVVFFYAVVGSVVGFAGRWRDLFNWAHLLGILIMLGLFALWAVPYFHAISAGQAAGKWYAQMAGRVEVGEKFVWSAYLLNGPRGLANFLPWVVLLPLAWWGGSGVASTLARAETSSLSARTPYPGSLSIPALLLDAAVARGVRWSLVGCFVAVSVAPGGIPRYTLPLLVPASVLLALTFTRLLPRAAGLPAALPLVWARVNAGCLWLVIVTAPLAAYFGGKGDGARRWLAALAIITVSVYLLRRLRHLRRLAEPGAPPDLPEPRVLPLALASGAVMGLLTANYAVGAMHRLHRQETVRPVGTAIRRMVPAEQQIAVLRPGFLPFLFYVEDPHYLQTTAALGPSVHYLLVRQDELPAVEKSLEKQGFTHRIMYRAKDKRIRDEARGTWVLLSLDRPEEPGL